MAVYTITKHNISCKSTHSPNKTLKSRNMDKPYFLNRKKQLSRKMKHLGSSSSKNLTPDAFIFSETGVSALCPDIETGEFHKFINVLKHLFGQASPYCSEHISTQPINYMFSYEEITDGSHEALDSIIVKVFTRYGRRDEKVATIKTYNTNNTIQAQGSATNVRLCVDAIITPLISITQRMNLGDMWSVQCIDCHMLPISQATNSIISPARLIFPPTEWLHQTNLPVNQAMCNNPPPERLKIDLLASKADECATSAVKKYVDISSPPEMKMIELPSANAVGTESAGSQAADIVYTCARAYQTTCAVQPQILNQDALPTPLNADIILPTAQPRAKSPVTEQHSSTVSHCVQQNTVQNTIATTTVHSTYNAPTPATCNFLPPDKAPVPEPGTGPMLISTNTMLLTTPLDCNRPPHSPLTNLVATPPPQFNTQPLPLTSTPIKPNSSPHLNYQSIANCTPQIKECSHIAEINRITFQLGCHETKIGDLKREKHVLSNEVTRLNRDIMQLAEDNKKSHDYLLSQLDLLHKKVNSLNPTGTVSKEVLAKPPNTAQHNQSSRRNRNRPNRNTAPPVTETETTVLPEATPQLQVTEAREDNDIDLHSTPSSSVSNKSLLDCVSIHVYGDSNLHAINNMLKNAMPSAIIKAESGATYESTNSTISNAEPCDIMVLQGGVNDAAHRDDPESLRETVKSLIATAKGKASEVLLLPPPPINTNSNMRTKIPLITRIVREEAELAEVTVVSLEAFPTRAGVFRSDNKHLTVNGSGHYGLALIRCIKAKFPSLLKDVPICTRCHITGHIGPMCKNSTSMDRSRRPTNSSRRPTTMNSNRWPTNSDRQPVDYRVQETGSYSDHKVHRGYRYPNQNYYGYPCYPQYESYPYALPEYYGPYASYSSTWPHQ